jgi:hypothetical protein
MRRSNSDFSPRKRKKGRTVSHYDIPKIDITDVQEIDELSVEVEELKS